MNVSSGLLLLILLGCPSSSTKDSTNWNDSGLTYEPVVEDVGPFSDLSDTGACPGSDGFNNDLLRASSAALASKLQMLGVAPEDASFAQVCDEVTARISAQGPPPPPIGDCPDGLTSDADGDGVIDAEHVSEVFYITCNTSSVDATTLGTLSYGLNATQNQNETGLWTGVSLNEAMSLPPDHLWIALFWSMQKFQTASALHFMNGNAEEASLAIVGLQVKVQWENQGSTDANAAARAEVEGFIADPLGRTCPQDSNGNCLKLRFRFIQVGFADKNNDVTFWSTATPVAPLVSPSAGCTNTASPWNLCTSTEVTMLPEAIIDPVHDAEELLALSRFIKGSYNTKDKWQVDFE